MKSRLQTVVATGLCLAALAGFAIACGSGSISPFLAAQFNQNIIEAQQNLGRPPVINPPVDDDDDDDPGFLASVCDLPQSQRSVEVTIQNLADTSVDFSLTFVVSAGPGGFVCDADLQNYLDAGYSDAIVPGSGDSAEIGCESVTLGGGTRILTMEFGENQGAAARIPPNNDPNITFPNVALPSQTLTRQDDGTPDIPLPELIIVGTNNPNFVCTANELCTQRGFVYVTAGGIPVGLSAEASRIQGTVCAENFGTAPQFLLDKSLDDTTQPFQYGRGGSIVFGVLDREDDPITSQRNQTVWLVIDGNAQTVQTPDF